MRSFLVALSCAALLGGRVFAQGQEPPPESVTSAALDAASAYLSVDAEDLILVMFAQRNWPDSSLGCPQPGMAYSQIVTPGYIVTVDTYDMVTEVHVHTDADGQHTAVC